MYLLAVLFPPAAVAIVGKPWQAILSCFLTPLLWVPGVLHAFAVIAEHKAEKRTDRLVTAIEGKHRRTSRGEIQEAPQGDENPFAF